MDLTQIPPNLDENNDGDVDTFSEYYEQFDNFDVPELSDDSNTEEEILWLALKGEKDKIIKLLDLNPELITCQDSDGYSMLHRASYNNKSEIVELLLSRGAPMDLGTNDGWLPIHSAAKWGNYECLKLLLMHGSPINKQTNGGQTALHLAASCRVDNECMKLLLSWPGLDPELKNAQGETSYDVAKRSSRKYDLFKIIQPCFNKI